MDILITISHRSNLNGSHTAKYGENHPNSIKWALYDGFNVEVDVWYIDKKYVLGHDKPEYEIDELVLINPLLWLHCKNIEALYKLYDHHIMNSFFTMKMIVFLHQTDIFGLILKINYYKRNQ